MRRALSRLPRCTSAEARPAVCLQGRTHCGASTALVLARGRSAEPDLKRVKQRKTRFERAHE
eukprot:1115335-Alexandrium_andersonii.AAC.1